MKKILGNETKTIRIEADPGAVAIVGLITLMVGCVSVDVKRINANKAIKMKAIEADIRRLKAYGDEQKLD